MNRVDAAAASVVDRVRRGDFILPHDCAQFFSQDASDVLRRMMKDGDLDRVVSFIWKARCDEQFRLGMHLLQGISRYTRDASVKSRIRGILEGLWPAARESSTRGTSVCFGLLDFPELPNEQHESLFQFILDNWDYHCENQRNWSGGAQHVVEKVEQRLGDPMFPASKHWVYVLALGASDNPDAVRQSLQRLSSDPHSLTQRAVREIKRRMFNE